jgi:AcrR family transcriptional regulator
MTEAADAVGEAAPPSRWTAREQEFLAITLDELQQHGYDRLSVETIAVQAKASKATVYRRWPSKADLVLAAFIEGTRTECAAPRTGSLRADLLEIGDGICRAALEHWSTMRAVLNETSHNAGLRRALQEEFIDQRKQVIDGVIHDAVARGEIDTPLDPEIFDLLPGYLVFRALVSGRPPTAETVRLLVDQIILPSMGVRAG